MKTIAEIKTEIATLISDHSKLDDYVGEQYKLKQKARKRIAILKGCMIYLESNPKPEFVLQMQAECNHKIDVFAKRLRLWSKKKSRMRRSNVKQLTISFNSHDLNLYTSGNFSWWWRGVS